MDCATWFDLDKNIAMENDIQIKNEDDLADIADNYDVIIGDIAFKKIIPIFKGEYIDFPHFAASGRMYGQ